MPRKICTVQNQTGKHVLNHAGVTAPTRRYGLDLTRQAYMSALKVLDHFMWKLNTGLMRERFHEARWRRQTGDTRYWYDTTTCGPLVTEQTNGRPTAVVGHSVDVCSCLHRRSRTYLGV